MKPAGIWADGLRRDVQHLPSGVQFDSWGICKKFGGPIGMDIRCALS
jgi:hypothetical protein